MQFRTLIAGCLLGALAYPTFAADMPPAAYAGQHRSIKTLSDEDIDALRKDEGMGVAKAAELNGYPTPPMYSRSASSLGLPTIRCRRRK
jgi:hypothetical protein